MKKIILILSCFLIMISSSVSAGEIAIYIPISQIYNIEKNNQSKKSTFFQIVGGIVFPIIVHESDHWWELENRNIPYEFEFNGKHGPTFNYTRQNNAVMRKINRNGFVAELTVGTILNLLPKTKKTTFTTVYNMSALAHIGLSKGLDGNDFSNIDKFGGDSDKDFLKFIGWGIGNNLFSLDYIPSNKR